LRESSIGSSADHWAGGGRVAGAGGRRCEGGGRAVCSLFMVLHLLCPWTGDRRSGSFWQNARVSSRVLLETDLRPNRHRTLQHAAVGSDRHDTPCRMLCLGLLPGPSTSRFAGRLCLAVDSVRQPASSRLRCDSSAPRRRPVSQKRAPPAGSTTPSRAML
jgi:hypothetical protein